MNNEKKSIEFEAERILKIKEKYIAQKENSLKSAKEELVKDRILLKELEQKAKTSFVGKIVARISELKLRIKGIFQPIINKINEIREKRKYSEYSGDEISKKEEQISKKKFLEDITFTDVPERNKIRKDITPEFYLIDSAEPGSLRQEDKEQELLDCDFSEIHNNAKKEEEVIEFSLAGIPRKEKKEEEVAEFSLAGIPRKEKKKEEVAEFSLAGIPRKEKNNEEISFHFSDSREDDER